MQTLRQRRELLGAGYFGIEVLAPIIGVLCITSEYRHKTITTSLVLARSAPGSSLAKVVATALWSIFIALLPSSPWPPSACPGTPPSAG